MKTITRSSFALIPIIAFAVTIIISNGVTRSIAHHHAAPVNAAYSPDETVNGSYRTMFEGLNSISTR